MARRTVSLRRNADGVLTLKSGRLIEHIGTADKTRGQVFDSVKWAAFSKGIPMQDHEVVELMNQAMGT